MGEKFLRKLDHVYHARGQAELGQAYDEWAETYDGDLQQAEYRLPSIAAGLIARYASRYAKPILDVGVGTGLLGSLLWPLGYKRIIGIDISERMLGQAGLRRVYEELQQVDVMRGIPFPDHAFSATAAVGVFGLGHLRADVLPELVRVTFPGGLIVFSVSSASYEEYGFADAISNLERAESMQQLEETEEFAMYPGNSEAAHLTGKFFAYRVV